MKRAAVAIALASAAFVGVCPGNTASAAPSVWSAARNPQAASREELLQKAEKVIYNASVTRERAGLMIGDLSSGDATQLLLLEARMLLERAGGGESPNMMVRFRYAHVLRSMGQDQKPQNRGMLEKAAQILTSVLATHPPPALALNLWNELALCHAVLGQREKEIVAYGEALNLEPVAYFRSRLLANRAESYMGLGRVDEAIEGYREAIDLLQSNVEMFQAGVTALWGLAVATDRNGDLEDALDKIKLARQYDPADTKLRDGNWFYSPPHDEHWYDALGFWLLARSAEDEFERRAEYAEALQSWDAYIQVAGANDPYVALARARRQACEKERDRAVAKARKR